MSTTLGEVVSGVQTVITSGLHTVSEAVSTAVGMKSEEQHFGLPKEQISMTSESSSTSAEPQKESWTDFVKRTPTNVIIEKRVFDLIQATPTFSVNQVLGLLAQHNISSVPVVKNNQIIGLVDVLDIITYALTVLGEDKFLPTEAIDEKFAAQFDRNIMDIMNASKRDFLKVMSSEDSLQKLITVLGNPDIHRVAIVNKDKLDHYDGIITQSLLLKYIYFNRNKLEDRFKLKVRDLFPESAQVYSIPVSGLVMEAFSIMYQAKISGLAVIDNKGVLVGNISASDIKHVGLKDYESRIPSLVKKLRSPLDKFLNLNPKEGEKGVEPITVMLDDPVEKLVSLFCTKFNTSKFTKTHIHRVYVVDQNFKPLRAISMGDVIAQFRA
jgi:CBS domain-containing protein